MNNSLISVVIFQKSNAIIYVSIRDISNGFLRKIEMELSQPDENLGVRIETHQVL